MTVGELIEQVARYDSDLDVEMEDEHFRTAPVRSVMFCYVLGPTGVPVVSEVVLSQENPRPPCSKSRACSLMDDHLGECVIVEGAPDDH